MSILKQESMAIADSVDQLVRHIFTRERESRRIELSFLP